MTGNLGLRGFSSTGYLDKTYYNVYANMSLWLKSDEITGKSDGDAISTWSDMSGNGHDAIQSTGSQQPIYKVNIQNGRPCVLFDNSKDGMTSTLNITNPFSIFIVYNCLTSSSFFGRALNGQ